MFHVLALILMSWWDKDTFPLLFSIHFYFILLAGRGKQQSRGKRTFASLPWSCLWKSVSHWSTTLSWPKGAQWLVDAASFCDQWRSALFTNCCESRKLTAFCDEKKGHDKGALNLNKTPGKPNIWIELCQEYFTGSTDGSNRGYF